MWSSVDAGHAESIHNFRGHSSYQIDHPARQAAVYFGVTQDDDGILVTTRQDTRATLMIIPSDKN